MNRTEKTAEIQRIKDNFERAKAVVFADYKGVKSEEMNAFRRSMRGKDIEITVLKNNLVRMALKDSPKKAFAEDLAGPMVATFAFKDPVELAKGLTDFAKKVEAFTIKDGLLGDQRVGLDQVKQLASLPSREVLVAQLLSVLNGPIRGFVTVLSAVPRDFTRVLQAIADKKGKSE